MKKFLLSLLVMLATVATASAYDFMVGGLAYNINSDGTTVRVTYEQRITSLGWDEETQMELYTPSYTNLSGAVTIPSTVTYNGTTYSVVDIEQEAFWACVNVTSISIPATVTSIERNPWNYCDALNQLTVDENNPVYATPENSNTIVTKQAVTVNVWIFNIINGAPYIYTIAESYLKDQVVAGCNSSTIPSVATSIGRYAFQQCRKLTSIVIPEGVTLVDMTSFNGCVSLNNLTLPSTITYIGNSAFAGCEQLTDVYAYFNPANVEMGGRSVWENTVLPDFPGNHKVNLHLKSQYAGWYEQQEWYEYGDNDPQHIQSAAWVPHGNRFNVIYDLGIELYLAGSFGGWANGKVPFTMGNDGKWTITQAMDAGAEFKLIRILEGQQGMTWIGGNGVQITQEQVENGEEIELMIGYGSNFQIPVAGTWTISVDLTTNKMVISGEWNEQVIDPAMYIIGSFNDWNQETQEAMTAGENNTWTITKTLEAGVQFKFRDELGTWYGGIDENGVNYFEVTKAIVTDGTPINLIDGENFMIPVAGTWTFTITRGETMTLVISGEWVDPLPEPTEVYIMGEVNGNNWGANTGVQMATEDHITFTSDVTCGPVTELDEDGFAYFSFTTKLDANNDWDVIAPYRFGAESPDLLVSEEMLGTELTLQAGGNAFKLADGEYSLSLNLETMKLVITKKAADLKVGDVTGDGLVDIDDVNAVINIILKVKEENDYPGVSDLNNDGTVDVDDMNIVINIILTQNNQ